MNDALIRLFLANDHAAELLREAERERLRRAALGTTPPVRQGQHPGSRSYPAWAFPWIPRHTG